MCGGKVTMATLSGFGLFMLENQSVRARIRRQTKGAQVSELGTGAQTHVQHCRVRRDMCRCTSMRIRGSGSSKTVD